MTGHERLIVMRAVRRDEIERITVHPSSVVMMYAGIRVVVLRRNSRVVHPPALADDMTRAGVPERAEAAVNCLEGHWTRTPGPEFKLAAAAFKRELSS